MGRDWFFIFLSFRDRVSILLQCRSQQICSTHWIFFYADWFYLFKIWSINNNNLPDNPEYSEQARNVVLNHLDNYSQFFPWISQWFSQKVVLLTIFLEYACLDKNTSLQKLWILLQSFNAGFDGMSWVVLRIFQCWFGTWNCSFCHYLTGWDTCPFICFFIDVITCWITFLKSFRSLPGWHKILQ